MKGIFNQPSKLSSAFLGLSNQTPQKGHSPVTSLEPGGPDQPHQGLEPQSKGQEAG